MAVEALRHGAEQECQLTLAEKTEVLRGTFSQRCAHACGGLSLRKPARMAAA